MLNCCSIGPKAKMTSASWSKIEYVLRVSCSKIDLWPTTTYFQAVGEVVVLLENIQFLRNIYFVWVKILVCKTARQGMDDIMNWHIAHSLGHSMSVCSGYIEQKCLHHLLNTSIHLLHNNYSVAHIHIVSFCQKLECNDSDILQHFRQQAAGWEEVGMNILGCIKTEFTGNTLSCHSCIVNKARSTPHTPWRLIRRSLQ